MANFVVLYVFINLSSKTKSNLYEMYGKKVAKAVSPYQSKSEKRIFRISL